MKTYLTVLISISIFLLAGCEKPITAEEQATGTGSRENKITPIDTVNTEYMTVAEALDAPVGEAINVKAYIVAATKTSMGNAKFRPPFDGLNTAIVLADEPVDTLFFQYLTNERLFPVCLTDYKDVRLSLNLESNPQLWNRLIYISGTKQRYMSCPGMKKVQGWNVGE
jgi:hypothetical protein